MTKTQTVTVTEYMYTVKSVGPAMLSKMYTLQKKKFGYDRC